MMRLRLSAICVDFCKFVVGLSANLWWGCLQNCGGVVLHFSSRHDGTPAITSQRSRRRYCKQPPAFTCLNCGKCFSRADATKRHLKNGSCKTFDQPLKRSQRDNNKRRKRLKVNITLDDIKWELQHDFDQEWKCPNACGKTFGRDDTLRLHLMNKCGRGGRSGHARELSSPNTETLRRHNDVLSSLIPSPNDPLITSHILSATLTEKATPELCHPDACKILHEWDSQQYRPTWELGREILVNWFSKPYPSLARNNSSEADAKSPLFTWEPHWKSVITDLQAAGKGMSQYKLRMWNSVTNQMENGVAIKDLVARRFDDSSVDPPLSALGIKTTEKGLRSCDPRLPSYFADGLKLASVPETITSAAMLT